VSDNVEVIGNRTRLHPYFIRRRMPHAKKHVVAGWNTSGDSTTQETTEGTEITEVTIMD